MSDDYIYVDPQGQQVNPNQYSYIPGGGTQRSDKADLLDKIRPDAVVEIIRHKLLGERWSKTKQVWVKVDALQERALTEEGAEAIANLMLSVSTQNTSISKLNDQEIKARVRSLTKTAQLMLLERWKEFGIKDKSQMRFVHEIIFSNSLVVLKQPEGDGIKRLLSATIQESRVETVNEKEKQGGLRGLFRLGK